MHACLDKDFEYVNKEKCPTARDNSWPRPEEISGGRAEEFPRETPMETTVGTTAETPSQISREIPTIPDQSPDTYPYICKSSERGENILCPDDNSPVCGYTKIDFSFDNCYFNFKNKCTACKDPTVALVKKGKCPGENKPNDWFIDKSN